MERIKINGLCLERLADQIRKAKNRLNGNGHGDRVLIESYNTGDLYDIMYILELYDLEERTPGGLREELKELALTISLLTREILTFDYTEAGHLGLYLTIRERVVRPEVLAAAYGGLDW